MKKIFLSLALIILSVSAFAQLSATALSGSDGYFVGRGSYDLSFIPGLTVAPTAAVYKSDSMEDDMYQVGLKVEAKVPLWDALKVGVKGGYTPKRNYYSNYFYEGYAKVNLESLIFHVVEFDNLTIGAGARQTEHKFYSPDYKLGETDGYVSLGGTKGGFDGTLTYTRALNFSGDRIGDPAWLDVPGFTAVTRGFLQYALGANLGYTYQIVRPYVNYTYLKTYNTSATDNLALGATVKVGIVAINAAVEWLDVSNKNHQRQTFYSINGGISF
ncbi:MAG: hypothetical protein J6S61_00065 [Elusimicrobiaceae bacterium]|nr:hypothetical protein [Elusimicrobiaceae bacterium]